MRITHKELEDLPVLRHCLTGLRYEILEALVGENPRTALYKVRMLRVGAEADWRSITELDANFEIDEPEDQTNDFYNQSDEQRDRRKADN